MWELTFARQDMMLYEKQTREEAAASPTVPPSLAASFCRSQFPHKSVNLFVTLVIIKDKMMDLCGNWLLKNDLRNTF